MTPTPIRFVLLGGFLGAGKTTTIARLARQHADRGYKVGIVTNDHAGELVDTYNLRSQGFNVGEIPGGCFCGSLDEFTRTVDELSATDRPDIVLVEPIGSCTDLAATVIRPLREQFGARFEIAPYCVLLKPSHGLRILRGDSRGGFSPQAEYLFRKQLDEADCIAINRADQLTPAELNELESLLAEEQAGVPVLRISARTGAGIDALFETLQQRGEFGQRRLEIDYDRYAAAEAELGWFNGTCRVSGQRPFDLDGLLGEIVARVQESLVRAAQEAAHLKVLGLADGACGVVNLIANDAPPDRSLVAARETREARLVVNARVAAHPDALSAQIREALDRACQTYELVVAERHVQCFRPGQPVVRLVSIG